ncbi:hypothetical protein LFREDSHE_24790 [Shewanella baltica]
MIKPNPFGGLILKLLRYSITTQSLRTIAMPYRVGSFGLTQNAEQLIVAFDRDIALHH